MNYKCQNCHFETSDQVALRSITDIYQRVAPGEPMPAGECPECGALVHLEDGRHPDPMAVAAELEAAARACGLHSLKLRLMQAAGVARRAGKMALALEILNCLLSPRADGRVTNAGALQVGWNHEFGTHITHTYAPGTWVMAYIDIEAP